MLASAHTSTYFAPNIVTLLMSNLEIIMLETIAIVLIILWLLGLITSYSMGGFIHILMVIAIVVILVRVIRGKRL
ncbi:lmo0937 family membrane protein [Pseudoalteromonas tunicata]